MNYEKITVKKLAELANINRKTFYLHYNSLDDLLDELIQEGIDEYAHQYPFPGKQDLPRLIRDFFLLCTEENGFWHHIICDEGCRSIFARAHRKTMKLEARKSKNEFQYRENIENVFFLTSNIEIFRQWINDGKRIPLDDIITLATQLICHGIHGKKNPDTLLSEAFSKLQFLKN